MKRILVVGAGLIGIRHIGHIRAHPDMVLAGVVDPNAEMTKGIDEPCFGSINEVDVPVDGIVIATPTHLHLEHAEKAAERGWHMLIEKPVAETIEQADGIIKIAEANRVKTLVGHQRRYHHLVQTLKEQVATGVIGRPLTATMIWAMRKPSGYFQGNWRQGPHGSPVLINLVHDIDILRYVLGEISQVTGLQGVQLRKADRVESGAICLGFENGCVGSITFSDASASPWGFEAGTGENPNIATTGQDMLWLTGTHGAISFPSLSIWSGASDWSKKPDLNRIEVEACVPLIRQLEHFCAVMEGSEEPLISAADARQTLAVALKAQKALNGSS